MKDIKPAVETQFGFIEPYRDPFGVRAEFEGLVALVDAEETKLLTKLVENSARFIRRLPWAGVSNGENDGKGPFEKDLFEAPDFTSLHGMRADCFHIRLYLTWSMCSACILFEHNLPWYQPTKRQLSYAYQGRSEADSEDSTTMYARQPVSRTS